MPNKIIELRGLEKRYRMADKDLLALHDVHLDIESGNILGIIGRSGAGKSTLLRSINQLEHPDKGQVLFQGQDLSKLSERNLRKVRGQMGMIFQHFNLLARRTLLENVALPLEIMRINKEERLAKALKSLATVGLQERAHAYPSELSGGQKQRVGIARALAGDAKVLLSDEATSALDPESTTEILHLLKNLNQNLGLTIVLITHEMQVIRDVCDQVCVMDHGQIIEQGPVETIFANPRHTITKTFVDSVINKRIPDIIRQTLLNDPRKGPHDIVLRLSFSGGIEHKPIISHFVRESGTDINIVAGYIDQIGKSAYGTLVVTLNNEAKIVSQAIRTLTTEGVHVETLGYLKLHD